MIREIALSQGVVAIVDDEDYDELVKHKWYANKIRGFYYAVRKGPRFCGEQEYILMHRIIMKTPDGYETDHKNRNTLDNRKTNLRVCTASQNQANCLKKTGLSSIYKGVNWDKNASRWKARINHMGERIVLGNYKSEIDAARAYDMKAKELFGEFAQLNFPEKNESEMV